MQKIGNGENFAQVNYCGKVVNYKEISVEYWEYHQILKAKLKYHRIFGAKLEYLIIDLPDEIILKPQSNWHIFSQIAERSKMLTSV